MKETNTDESNEGTESEFESEVDELEDLTFKEGDWVEVYCTPEENWFSCQVVGVETDGKVKVYFEEEDAEGTISGKGPHIRRTSAPMPMAEALDVWSDEDVPLRLKA